MEARSRLFVAAAAALLLCAALADAAPAAPAASWSAMYSSLTGRTPMEPAPEFCVIVRTYWGHGKRAGDGGLRRLLRSLQRQTVQSWEAVLLVLDSRPFEDLHHMVQDLGDDRIWVFAEWIDKSFTPKQGAEWTPGYHGTLYNLTDDAIQAGRRWAVCPPSTKWLVVTNGDNEYAENFMQLVKDAGAGADLVAVDFYSRYQRPTAPSCERFAAVPGGPACKTNRLRWCHTDLGANAIGYQRFQQEGRRFGTLESVSGGLGAEHFDGIMMQTLMAAGWRVQHLHGACPFNHAPSLQSCGWSGGVWDDRDIVSWATAGGRCLSAEEAARVLAEEADVEEVVVQASSDGNVTAFEGVRPEQLAVRCLRKRHYMRDDVLGAQVAWFNALCVEDFDLPAFREWQRAVAAADAAAPAAGGEGSSSEPGGDVAARAAAAAAAAAAAQDRKGDAQQPEDFYSLQDEFYKREEEPAGAAAAAGAAGAVVEEEEEEEAPTATQR